MKILITGANGMLAKAVINEFKDCELICTDVSEVTNNVENINTTSVNNFQAVSKLDITNLEDVEAFVSKTKPEYIINCAAYTAVDKAEDEEELARKVNSIGPKNLSIVASKQDATLIHISTDYVFGGAKSIDEAYVEDDEKNPTTVYGITKLEGEKEITKNCNKYYIFRTAWLFGDGKNFVRTMLKLGEEKEEVNVVSDQHGSPTYTVDLAKVIHDAIEKQIPYGIYHATNEGFTTWYEFTRKIFEMENIKCKVNPVTSEEFPSKAKRPKNSKLSKEKLLNEGIHIPTYEDALKRYLQNS